MKPRVLVLDDDPDFTALMAGNLGRPGEFRVETFEDPEALLESVEREVPDAVLTDLVMPGLDGIEVTRRIRARYPRLPVFIFTGRDDVRSAVEGIQAGANDYLIKPVNLTELAAHLRKAMEERTVAEQYDRRETYARRHFSEEAILGSHPKVEAVRDFVRTLTSAPASSVLLLGESGTGKNLVARAIHYAGGTESRLVEVNCSAVPEHLLEAELFGHTKGAFTGAHQSRRGLVEAAHGGTHFLDEIGDMPLELQAKLLSFLESHRFRRLGSSQEIEVELRLITATNKDLERLVAEGRFREDLLYRIQVVTKRLPPLREIVEDIPALAEHFLEHFATDFRKDVRSIAPEAMERLMAWSWPGNARELRNVIERSVIFATGTVIGPEDLPAFGVGGAGVAAGSGDAGAGRGSAGGADTVAVPAGLTLKEVEREYIRETVERMDGDIQRSAESLGISRKNLWEKRKRHGLLE